MEATFPPTIQDDPEDVAWALSTGAALFKRGEHDDAVVWLKRAADAASEAGNGARAQQLGDAATNLAAALAKGASKPAPVAFVPMPEETDGPGEPALSPPRAAPPPPPRFSKPPPPPPMLRKPDVAASPKPTDIRPNDAPFPDAEQANEPTGHRIQPPSPRTPDGDTSTPGGTALSLAVLRPLAELSEAVQSGLLQSGVVETLAADEEAKLSGLALVVKGDVVVAATIADGPATKMAAGDVIYAKGSIADSLSLRLVAREPGAVVVVWDQRASDEALSTSPPLLERLKRASTRVQALAGATLGPIGERLDDNLRAVLMERLDLRVLAPGQVVAEAGAPVAGMIIVGVGAIELEVDGEIQERLGPGDVLFGSEVLGGGTAPATAVAGAKGAVVLFGERRLVHEIAVTCPPLLEILTET